MSIQSKTALAAAMTLTLAVGAPLLAAHLSGTALAQSSGSGGGSSGGSTGGMNSGGAGGTNPGGAMNRGESTDPRGTTDQRGTTDRGGVSDPMRRSGGSSGAGPAAGSTGSDTMRSGSMSDRSRTSGSSMSGSSGSDATRPGMTGGRSGTGSDSGLVGTEKLTAALGVLDGGNATARRGSARSARIVMIEEYETAMRNAHAINDPAERSRAISEARDRLQGASGQPVPSDTLARVDSILGLPAAPMTR